MPFAYVRGVGDVVAFDLDKRNVHGLTLVVDCFHELSPSQWEGICFGLRTWLQGMARNGFQPFWLQKE